MAAVQNNNSAHKFKRLFVLTSIYTGVLLIVVLTALSEDPKGFFPFFLFIFPFLLLMFSYFYMLSFLGKHGYLEYSPKMFLKYFQIPSDFLKRSASSFQRIIFYIYIAAFIMFIFSVIWIESHSPN